MINILLKNKVNKEEKWFTLNWAAYGEEFINEIETWLTNKRNSAVAEYSIIDFKVVCWDRDLHNFDKELIQKDEDFNFIVKMQDCIDVWQSADEYEDVFAALLENYTPYFILFANPDSFELETNIGSYEDLAKSYLKDYYGDSWAVDELLPYIDLESFGQDIADRKEGFITDYGYIYIK